MKKTILIAMLMIASISFVAAAQPSKSCGSADAYIAPNGFNTAGFAHAETVYAGSDGTASLLHANSPNAVSQYDVACYQLTQHQ